MGPIAAYFTARCLNLLCVFNLDQCGPNGVATGYPSFGTNYPGTCRPPLLRHLAGPNRCPTLQLDRQAVNRKTANGQWFRKATRSRDSLVHRFLSLDASLVFPVSLLEVPSNSTGKETSVWTRGLVLTCRSGGEREKGMALTCCLITT